VAQGGFNGLNGSRLGNCTLAEVDAIFFGIVASFMSHLGHQYACGDRAVTVQVPLEPDGIAAAQRTGQVCQDLPELHRAKMPFITAPVAPRI
jgi:hypothetical protein